ncbi:MAG: transglycosylase SLT domain-containing protein [Patescibacteria group bacterium]
MEKTPISNIKVEKRYNPGKWAQGTMKAGLIGSTLALGAMAKEGYSYTEKLDRTEESAKDTNERVERIDDAEMIAEELPSPVFEKVLAARTIEAGELRRDQVLFVDSLGRQITEPFNLTESVGLSPEEMTWRFEGAGPKGIPGAWIKEQEAYIGKQLDIPTSDINMLHVYQDLSSTRAEHMNSKVELVYDNATTPLETDPQGRDALSIIRLETNFTQLTPRVEEEFTPYLIGLAAEESRFDANKTSKAGAVGLLQTMPRTFEGYIKEHNLPHLDPRNLLDQLPVGVQHIETSYTKLAEDLDLELAYITKVYFDGNTASMEKYFLVPLMINSYNAGQRRMTEVVRWFLENYPEPESTAELVGQTEPLSGYDVFFAMIHQCAKEKGVEAYGPEASTYVSKVMGWTQAFSDYEKKQQEVQMASN